MKKEPSEDQVEENNLTTDDRLEAVRDLLFGQNVQEYRGEFKELKDQLNQNKEDLDKGVTDLQSDLLAKLEAIDKKLSDRIEEMNSQLNSKLDSLNNDKVDRKKLAKLLQSIASELDS